MSITIYKIPKTKSSSAIFERSMLLLLVLVLGYGIANAGYKNIRVIPIYIGTDERGIFSAAVHPSTPPDNSSGQGDSQTEFAKGDR